MSTLLKTALFGTLLCAPAVFAQNVDVEFDESVNFANYKTFRFGAENINAKAPALNNDLVKKNIETDLRTHLGEKKLTEVTSGQADLVVRYTLGAGQKGEVTAFPAGRLGQRARVVRSKFTEGTLRIELLAARELVWQATVTDDEKDPAKVAAKLDKMVKKAMEKFPPKK